MSGAGSRRKGIAGRAMRSGALAFVGLTLAGCQLVALAVGGDRPYPDEVWSSTLLPPDPVLAAAAPRACAEPFDVDVAGWRIAVQAQHSSHRAAFILTDGNEMIECTVSRPTGGEPVPGNGVGFGTVGAHDLAGETGLMLMGESSGGPASSAYGQVGSDVVSVRITTTSGNVVQAALGEGWFLAMWPGLEQVVLVEGIDADGSVIARADGMMGSGEPPP